MIISLSDDKVLAYSTLKGLGFVDNKLYAEKYKFVMGGEENIVGKGENAGNQHFLLFPQCFQRASYTRLLTVIMCGIELRVKK